MMKANNQLGFININEDSIDEIIKDGEVIFERGFLREKTSTTLPTTFDGVGKDLKDYKIDGNTVQSKLPDGYTQVDYIESSGTQYIDTGVNADSNLDIDVKMAIISSSGTSYMGAMSNNFDRYHFDIQSSNAVGIWLTTGNTGRRGLINDGTIATRYKIFPTQNYYEVNGVQTSNTFPTIDTGQTFWLFGRHYTTLSYAKLKLYDFKMYYNGTLVRDFIPCYRNSDNEVGLYDLVNNVFYTNQGTGVFTYGSIAPTPDTPIDMVSCGDRTKNVFDKNNATILNAYIGASNSTITSLISYRTTYLKVKPNTYYTVSKNSSNDLRIGLSTNNNVDIGDILTNVARTTTDNKLTILTNNDTKTLAITYAYTTVDDEVKELNSLMVEEGSTVTSYEPYGYKIPVNVRSENLLNTLEISETTDRTLTYKSNTKGELIINGTAFNGNINFKTNLNKKLNGDYTFIFKKISGSIINDSIVINHRFSIGNSENPGAATVDGRLLTNVFNSSSDVVIVTGNINDIVDKFSIYFNRGCTFNNYTFQIYLVKGIYTTSNLPTYQPYYNETTNIYLDEPLRKIDEYSDYIDFINGKVVRQLGEVVLNGSEDWTTIQAYGRNYYAVAISNLLISNSGSNDALLYNNYYIGYKSNELVGNNTKDYGICRRNNNSQVLFRDKDQSILSDLTTWLSTHNNIMCYPLATPIEESITLPNIPTVEGNNTLNIETEITPSQVYIKYKSNN